MAVALSSSQKKAVQALLDKGDVEGAQNIINGAIEAAKKEPPKPAAPEKPRTVQEVTSDIFKAIHSLLGNSPALTPLINEYNELVTPKEEEEPAPAAEPTK